MNMGTCENKKGTDLHVSNSTCVSKIFYSVTSDKLETCDKTNFVHCDTSPYGHVSKSILYRTPHGQPDMCHQKLVQCDACQFRHMSQQNLYSTTHCCFDTCHRKILQSFTGHKMFAQYSSCDNGHVSEQSSYNMPAVQMDTCGMFSNGITLVQMDMSLKKY